MTEIILHPEVENYIVEWDWQEVRTGGEALRAELVAAFEDGKLILLRNHGLEVDFELLNSFELPRSEKLRKLPYNRLIYPKLWRADHRLAVFGTFGLDLSKYLKVRREIKRVNRALKALTQDVFTEYRFLREQYSWRLLDTPVTIHPLHIDFHSGADLHYARFFLNIDSEPRVWRISHRMDEVVRRHHDDMAWQELNELNPDMFCDTVGNHLRDKTPAPCHEVRFAQGDLWLCDTRTISHAVMSGRRMVATHFWVDPESMAVPSKRVQCRVAALRETYGRQPRVATQ